MTVKINAQLLGIKKPIKLEETNKLMKKVLKVQIDTNKAQNIDIEDQIPDGIDEDDAEALRGDLGYVAFLESNLKIQEINETFLIDVLHLDEKQQDLLDKATIDDTNTLIQEVIMKVLHLDQIIDNDTSDEDDSEPSNARTDA